jgi:polysaccharide export outer membrane protein
MKVSNKMFWLTRTLATVLVSFAAAAAQQNLQTVPPGESTAGSTKSDTGASKLLQDRHVRYNLQAGDSFDISFELSPEFNQTVTVQPDGFVTLRGVGDVFVTGQTVPQVTETLRTAYSKILNDPMISVLLKDFEKPYFTVDGQVGRPGKYDLRGDTTVTQALAEAGGVLASAKHSQVLLFRHVSDQWMEARVLNVKKMMKEGNLNEDLQVHPGDMVFVPKNAYSKIERFFPSANMGTYFHY